MIKQLRPFHSQELLDAMYAVPHNHNLFGRGHHIRVEITKVLLNDLCNELGAVSGADLSCGNAEIIKSAPLGQCYLGDFAEGYTYQGPLDATLTQIPNVDVYVCSETLEHVEDPPAILKAIREKSRGLILTTPIEKWDDSLAEHYWAWDRQGIEEMLVNAGWRIMSFNVLDTTVFREPYKYGMWGCI